MSVQNKDSNNDELDLGLEPSDDTPVVSSEEDIIDIELEDLDELSPLPDTLAIELEPIEDDSNMELDIELEDIKEDLTRDILVTNLLTEGEVEAPQPRKGSSGIVLRKEDRALTNIDKTQKYLAKLYKSSFSNIESLTTKILSTRAQNANIGDFELFIVENKPANIPSEAIGRIRSFIINEGISDDLSTDEIIRKTRVEDWVKADIDKFLYRQFLVRSAEENARSSKNLSASAKATKFKIQKLEKDYFFKDFYSIAPYLNDESEFVFVNKIYLRGDSESFDCGKCGSKVKAEFPFVSIILTYNNDSENRKIPWFIPNRCPECGAINTLTDMECKALEKKLKNVDLKVDTIDANSEGVPTVVRYKYKNSILEDILPDVFSIEIEEIQEVVDTGLDDMTDAIKRYKDKHLTFYNKKFTREVHEADANLKLMSRTLCTVTGHVYDTIKKHAVNSLLVYLSTSSVLYDILSENTNKLYSIAVDNTKHLYKTDLEPYEYETITRNICLDLGVKYEQILNEDGTLNNSIFNRIKKDIEEAKEDIKEQIKENNDLRNTTLSYLESNQVLYSYLLISQITSVDSKVERDLTNDSRLVKWIDDVSELMILNSITEELIPFWTSVSTCKLDTKLKGFLNAYSSEAINKKLTSILESVDRVANKTKSYFVNDIKEYLLYYTATISPLYCFRKLRNDFKSFSTFKIMQGLHSCMPLLNTSIIEIPYMKDIKDMLLLFEKEVKDFINKNGTTDKDYFKFVFPFFDIPEQSLRSSLLREYEKHLFVISPLDGETPMEYYERYKLEAPKKYINDEDVRVVEDTTFISKITKYSALIYGATHIYDYCSENVSDFRKFILFKDIILNSTKYNTQDVFRCMGINPNFVSYLSNMGDLDFQINPKDLDKDYIETYLLNCVYPDDELNDIRNDSDLTSSQKISEITKDVDKLLDIIMFFDEKERSLVNEYYIARGQEV